jgi:RNA polymerase sigma-70 factor (ECF subfamily)
MKMEAAMNDYSLVERANEGDLDSFAALVIKYEQRVYRLSLGVLKHHEDAEDVTQETFIQAFRALPGFRGDALFYTWLYRIALNKALSRRAQQRLWATHFRTDGDDACKAETLGDSLTQADCPSAQIEYKQALQTIERILTEMPEQFADALILRVVEGLSYEEISDARAMSVNTVRTRIFRAREFLANRMDISTGKRGYCGDLK